MDLSREAALWRDRWRAAGPSLLRGAGVGFAAVALLQGALTAERFVGAFATAGDGHHEVADLTMAEPAAGPQRSEPADQGAASAAPEEERYEHPLSCEPRLLQAIQERSRQLDARAAELADRARMLEVIEARAAEQVRALEAQRQALETTLAGVEEGTEAEVARLVKIYENMNPKEAARIFEAMPAEVAAGFIRRMGESKSALVMGRLGAQHAYAITLAMANSAEPSRDP